MASIGERLREARGDIPRKNVCEKVGISLSALMMYENDKRVPRDSIKIKLAELYGKKIEELFYLT